MSVIPTLRRIAAAVADNPVVTRECTSRLRDARLLLALAAYVMSLAVIALIMMAQELQQDRIELGRVLVSTLTGVQAVLLLLILPSYAGTAISGEKEKGSFEFVVMSGLRSWEILLGKWIATIAYAVIFLIASAPVICLVFIVGGVAAIEVLVRYAFLLGMAIVVSLLGLSMSARYSSTKKSVPSSYVSVLILSIFGGWPLGFFLVRTSRGYGVSSYLAQSAHRWLSMVMTPVSIGYLIILIMACLFTTSANRIKGTGENKSTGLRIQYLIYAILTPILYMLTLEAWLGKDAYKEIWAVLWFLVPQTAIMTVLGMGFCIEEPVIRLKGSVPWLQWQGRRRAMAYLMPGSRTAIPSVILLSWVSILIPLAWHFVRQPMLQMGTRDAGKLLEIAGCSLVFIPVGPLLAFCLSTIVKKRVFRLAFLVVLGVLFAFFVPMAAVIVEELSRNSDVLATFACIHPFFAMVGRATAQEVSMEHTVCCMLIYGIAGLVLFLVAISSFRTWSRESALEMAGRRLEAGGRR